MNIQAFLINQGYIPMRKVYKNKEFSYVENFMDSFSTMVNGGLDIRYLKEGKEISFGLHEKGLPPTLIYPRPLIKVIRLNTDTGAKEIIDETQDSSMNIVLMKESPELIYKAMFDKSIVFEYDLTK